MVKKSKSRESENMTAAESEALVPDGTSELGLFRLMLSGLFAGAYVYPVGVNPEADGIVTALEGLKTKEIST
jgi:hypothetical protein